MLRSTNRERRLKVRLGLPLLSLAVLVLGFTTSARAQTTPRLFDAPISLASIGTADCVLDLNGDGNQDLLVGSFTASTVVLTAHAGAGTGDFGLAWTTSNAWPILPPTTPYFLDPNHRIERASLNTDNRDDFVFAIGSTVTAWLANTTGPATVAWTIGFPFEIKGMVIGDFDGNNLDDVAVLLLDSSIQILYSTSGAPSPIASSIGLYAGINDLEAIEIDGDGRPDLVLGSATGVLTGISVAASSPVVVFTTSYPNAAVNALVAGDWDGDADTDLRIVLRSTFPLPTAPACFSALLRRTGPSTFVSGPPELLPSPLYLYQIMPLNVGAGDADGDGFLDLAVSISPGVWVSPGSATTLLPGLKIDAALGLGSLRTADFDNDGRSDLLAGTTLVRGEPGRGWIFESGPGIALDRDPVDFDGDGDADLDLGKPGPALANPPYPGPHRNDGSGSFTPAADPLPPLPSGLAYDGPGYVGDFDGDGAVDVVANCTLGGVPQPSRFLRNLGGGNFADLGAVGGAGATLGAFPYFSPTWTVAASAESGLAVDVDADGDLDLVTRDPGRGGYTVIPPSSRVWINTAGPVPSTGPLFTAGPAFPTVYVHAVAEVTGDAIPDLVGIMTAAGGGGPPNSLVVIAGTGGGNFVGSTLASVIATSPVGWAASVQSVVVADVDGDIQPEIIAALGGTNPTVHRRLPGGWSPTALLGSPSSGLGRLWFMDVTLDGQPEVILADSGTRIWTGSPTGPGGSPSIYAMVPTMLGDFDGDGDVDALTSTSLFRGAVLRPPTNGRRLQQFAGLAGSGGLVPILGAGGAVRGGSTITLRLTNALGGAPALLGIGSTPASIPLVGGTLYLAPDLLLPFTVGGPLGAVGEGRFTIPAALPLSFVGSTVILQAGVGDAGAAQGVSLTNALTLTVGI